MNDKTKEDVAVTLAQPMATVKKSYNRGESYPCSSAQEGARMVQGGFADEDSAPEAVKTALKELRAQIKETEEGKAANAEAMAAQAAKDKAKRAAAAKAKTEKAAADAAKAQKAADPKAAEKKAAAEKAEAEKAEAEKAAAEAAKKED